MFESTEWDLFKMWNSQCDGWWPVICRCSRSVDTTQVRYQWKLSFQCYSLEVLTCMLRSIVQYLKQCFGGTACKFSCLRKSPNKIFGMDHSDAKPVLLLYTIIRIFFKRIKPTCFYDTLYSSFSTRSASLVNFCAFTERCQSSGKPICSVFICQTSGISVSSTTLFW